MHRFRFLVVIFAVLTLSSPTIATRAQDAATPAATSGTDWMGFRGNPARTGVTSATGPLTNPEIRWKVETGGGWRHSAAVVDGIVYTTTEANLLLATDAATGDEIWRFDLIPTFGHPVVADGIVVIGSDDGLYAVDAATGQQRWLFQPDGEPRPFDSSPLIVDGVVYTGAGSFQNPNGGLFALDAATGTERWRFDTMGLTFSSPAVVDGVVYIASEAVYTGDGSGTPSQVWAVNAADGAALWHYDTGTDGDTFLSTPAVADGTVYIGTQNAMDGPTYVLAIDAATGKEQWRFQTSRMFSAVAVDNGLVYIGSDALYAVDAATGKQVWRLAIGEVDSSPAVAAGVVYALSSEKYLVAADAATGKELWHIEVAGGFSSPAVVDGMIYLSGDDGFLYAIGEGTGETEATPEATADETAFADVVGETLTESTLTPDQLPPNPAFAGAFIDNWPVGIGYRYQEEFPGVNIICVLSGQWGYALVDESTGTPTAANETVLDAGECVTLAANQHRDERNAGSGPLSLLSFVVLPDGTPGPANIPHEITSGPPVAFFPPPDWSTLPVGPLTVTLQRSSLAPDASVGRYTGDGLGGVGAPSPKTTHVSYRPDRSVRNLGTAPVEIYLLTVQPEVGADTATAEPAPSTTETPVASPVAIDDAVSFLWQTTGGDEPFSFPGGIGIAPDGTIWVVDSGRSRFQIFDSDGTFIEFWGQQGSGDGEFNFTRVNGDSIGGLAFDADGNLYVADSGNRRIQKFDRDRNFVTAWGGFGTGDGQFIDPFGIAFDAAGNIYVIDDRRDDIQKFTADGAYLATIGEHGTGDGQLNFTGGVAVDGAGNILVADFGNNRVVRFSPDGSFLDSFGEMGSGEGQFLHLNYVALDGDGNIFVTDTDNQRIEVFTPDGTFLMTWGELGDAPGQFNLPVGIAVDDAGNVYVTDIFGNRVQKFSVSLSASPAATSATPAAG